MPRGGPDGNLSAFSYAAQAIDPALIYQMLWGFSPVDGQGRPFYLDTFNNGLAGFENTVSGAGAQPATLVSTPLGGVVFSPPNAVKLTPGTTSGSLTQLDREFFLGTNTRLGLEAAIQFSSTSPDYFFRIDYRVNATKRYVSSLGYSHVDGKWYIGSGGGNMFIFTQPPTAGNFHMQVKIVGDWNTGKYVRALIGDTLIDLSGYGMNASGAADDGFIAAVFRAKSYGAGCTDGYLGYTLLTKDEP